MRWVGALKRCVWGGSGCGGVVWVADQWRGCACRRGLWAEGASPILGRSILYLTRGCSSQGSPTLRFLVSRMPGKQPLSRGSIPGEGDWSIPSQGRVYISGLGASFGGGILLKPPIWSPGCAHMPIQGAPRSQWGRPGASYHRAA